MTLDEHFKDVAYETLNRTDFFEALEQAYPGVSWDKPYQEFKAAGERAARLFGLERMVGQHKALLRKACRGLAGRGRNES